VIRRIRPASSVRQAGFATKMLNYFTRRRFFFSIAGWASGFVTLPFLTKLRKLENLGHGYYAINGWVLTRDDVAAREAPHDVV
jgi:hypothetical protein